MELCPAYSSRDDLLHAANTSVSGLGVLSRRSHGSTSNLFAGSLRETEIISLAGFMSAALDTSFPIRATPTLLHRFLGQTHGRTVIALLLPNDAQLVEAVMRRYCPPTPSPEPHDLRGDIDLFLAGTDRRIEEPGIFLAIAIFNHNHDLKNVVLLEGVASDSFGFLEHSTCKVPAFGFIEPFGKIREKAACITVHLQSPRSR